MTQQQSSLTIHYTTSAASAQDQPVTSPPPAVDCWDRGAVMVQPSGAVDWHQPGGGSGGAVMVQPSGGGGGSGAEELSTTMRTSRLKKRTSVDTLPTSSQTSRHAATQPPPQRQTSTPKISKTASVGDAWEYPGAGSPGGKDAWPMAVLPPGELRVCSSDSRLSAAAGLYESSSAAAAADPMISMIDHDINSPPMTYAGDAAAEFPRPGFPTPGFPQPGFPQPPASYLLPCESMSVDIGNCHCLMICPCQFFEIIFQIVIKRYYYFLKPTSTKPQAGKLG